MSFDITIGTERAQSLQNAIQEELMKRGYSPEEDPVMAEYITIMLINNKTAEQITAELEDLIGASEYDASFTDWLFAEAARISAPQATSEPPAAQAQPAATPVSFTPSTTQPKRDSPPVSSRPRAQAIPVFNQALNQALPSGSGQKRTASARSPSPNMNTANKTRRMDGPLPTGPRAMHNRDGSAGQGGRSLLDRVGGRVRGGAHNNRDEIQARIDAVTAQGGSPDMMAQLAMNGGLPGGGMGMMPDMNAMNAMAGMNMGGMVNQMALQEMMMNQMALMAQMATTMGILPNAQNQGQFPPQANANAHNRQANGPQQQQVQGNNVQQRRGAPPRRGGHGAVNGAQWVAPHVADQQQNPATPTGPSTPSIPSPAAQASGPAAPSLASPTPIPGTAAQPGFTPPSRPQSPTLCKFGLKCTNALCRYAHPSPVATPESGIVLSTDACEAGKNCKDKDCIKSHVSPAAVGVTSVPAPAHKPAPSHAPPTAVPQIPCRYGANCLKITSGCPFYHPPKAVAAANHFNQQCRFGASCTRAACPFQHPPGRVLPTAFHRGLDPNTPTVNVRTPETGSIGASSHNKSVIFNKQAPKKPEEDKKEESVKTLEAAA